MPKIGKMVEVEQSPVHIVSIRGGGTPIRPSQIEVAKVDFHVDEFQGPYSFTPTDEEQTIQIFGKMATQNITINPIPQNYGLVTWDGVTLTVS